MYNFFQYMADYLNPFTLCKCKYITSDSYFEQLIKNKIGFKPYYLSSFIKNNNFLIFRKYMKICYNNNFINIKSGSESAYFKVVKNNKKIILIGYCIEFSNINNFKLMLKTFKKIFYEFYVNDCIIIHTIDLKIIIKTHTTIVIPPYIDFTLIDGKNKYAFNHKNANCTEQIIF